MATRENKTQITIVGLGVVGASAGLALRRYADRLTVVGHDKDAARASRAKNAGAVERTEWNLVNAVRGADRILLALPAKDVRETLDFIKDDLKPGVLLLDTAAIKAPVLAWAAELLPAGASLVGGHPILVIESQDPAEARADLFQDRVFCLCADARSGADAIRLASDLVEALGAKPYFVDPYEHDGLVAAVENLPALLAGALVGAVSRSPSWQEMRKLAGSQFYASSYVAEPDAKAVAEACLANGQNTVRWIDNLVAELEEWRRQLETGDADGLAQAFEKAMIDTQRWLRAQATGNWTDEAPPEMPTAGTQLRRMFGFGGRDLRNPPAKGGQSRDRGR